MTSFRRSMPYAAIFGAFAILYCAAAGLGAFSLSRLSSAGDEQSARNSIARQADILLIKIVEETSAVRQAQNMSLIAMTEPARGKERAAVHQAIGGVAALISDYEKYVDPQERASFVKWRDAWNDYVSMNDTLNEKAINESHNVAAEYYLYTMSDAFRHNFLAAIDAVIASHAREARDTDNWGNVYARIRNDVIVAAVVAALASILAIVLLVHKLAAHERHPRHIHEIVRRLDATMAKIDNISHRIGGGDPSTTSQDLSTETGVLKETVKNLISEVEGEKAPTV